MNQFTHKGPFGEETFDKISVNSKPGEVTAAAAATTVVPIFSPTPVSEHVVACEFADKFRDTMRYSPAAWRAGMSGTKPAGVLTRWRGRSTTLVHWPLKKTSRNPPARLHLRAASNRSVARTPTSLVEASYFDSDPWLLGTPDGTVDLKNRRIAKADPAHRITKLTAVGRGKVDECPRWLQFLDESTGSDPQLVAFLQRLVWGIA